MPKWVECNCRGLACFPVRAKGVLHRRKCDSDEAYVNRFSTCIEDTSVSSEIKTRNQLSMAKIRTCDTPALVEAPLSPQLPVAKLYFKPSVM